MHLKKNHIFISILQTYYTVSIASYAASVWSTNASDSSFKKIQTAQNAALRTATGAHKMASIDHLHQESLTLRVKDHSDMLSAQYLVNCLEKDHVCHGITTQEPRPRPIFFYKEEFIKQKFYKKKNKQNYYKNKINYNIHYLHLS